MSEYPYVPAAFINAIAEEGTKDEAVAFLQKQWNESCALRAALKEARLQIEYLDAKFQPTGTSASVLARIEAALSCG